MTLLNIKAAACFDMGIILLASRGSGEIKSDWTDTLECTPGNRIPCIFSLFWLSLSVSSPSSSRAARNEYGSSPLVYLVGESERGSSRVCRSGRVGPERGLADARRRKYENGLGR